MGRSNISSDTQRGVSVASSSYRFSYVCVLQWEVSAFQGGVSLFNSAIGQYISVVGSNIAFANQPYAWSLLTDPHLGDVLMYVGGSSLEPRFT